MKRLLFAVLILPLFGLAQDITNTLGTNGSFIIEDENNTNLIRATRQTGSDFLINIGDWTSSLSLPTGNVNFLHENGSNRVNIVTAEGSAFAAFPKLQFFYTPGSLSSPTEIGDGDALGIINFGGYRSSGGWVITSSIKSVVNGTPAGGVPVDLLFQTSDAGNNDYSMTFDHAGNLTVDGAVTSKAIKTSVLNVDNGDTYNITVNDQTIIVVPVGSGPNTANVYLPAAGALTGKTFTIKQGNLLNSVTVNSINSENIDLSNTAYVISGGAAYVTLQSNGTQWYVIAQGNGK